MVDKALPTNHQFLNFWSELQKRRKYYDSFWQMANFDTESEPETEMDFGNDNKNSRWSTRLIKFHEWK